MDKVTTLLARIFLSAIFIKAGIDKIVDPNSTISYMSSKGVPLPNLLIVPTIIVLLGGGLAILLGYKTKIGAWLLIGFLIPTTLIFHTNFPDGEIPFLKNLGLMGGLLMVASFGPGVWSLDRRKHLVSST
ncbi:MAG: Inner membrane protein YqjF [Chroococcopsis gigantea SAG 12.99]|jgi:putative oxidoreductase|nr:Inner membrane protein YqjF [Chroococcopsis gigantea SAG 12.99]